MGVMAHAYDLPLVHLGGGEGRGRGGNRVGAGKRKAQKEYLFKKNNATAIVRCEGDSTTINADFVSPPLEAVLTHQLAMHSALPIISLKQS